MKNYYEILEVSQNASDEIIARAYKVFAKKYHPDMNLDNPQEAEEKFKEVTEAYEVLSNPSKRQEYDLKLKREQASTNTKSNNDSSYANNQAAPTETDFNNVYVDANQINEILKEHENAVEQAYNDAYVRALKDMGYKIVYKKTPKEKAQSFTRKVVFIFVMLIVLFAVLSFPGVGNKVQEIINNETIQKLFSGFKN